MDQTEAMAQLDRINMEFERRERESQGRRFNEAQEVLGQLSGNDLVGLYQTVDAANWLAPLVVKAIVTMVLRGQG